ncbi:MAG: YidC/Oxa1 family membrane protein insertase [bacterium]|nr:YidC/Oxa1 family membrane protein insertase [bacterium]
MKKNKFIIIVVLLAFTLTGCTTILKDENNKTVVNPETGQSITKNILCQPENDTVRNIYTENQVDIDKLPKCASFKVTSGGYEGIWTNIFVKPLAWLIIQIGEVINSYGLSIIITTLLIRLLVMPITKKTAVQSENIKLAKPELDKLEKKYKDKTNQEEQMKKTQEMMVIYKKYNINPLAGCFLALIQLPLFFAFLEAINRVPAIFENTFVTFQMGTTPLVGMQNGNYQYIILIILIVITTYFSFQNTLKDQASTNGKQMKFTMYFMMIFILIASLSFPAATAIYWVTSSVFTIFQNELVKRKKKKHEVL